MTENQYVVNEALSKQILPIRIQFDNTKQELSPILHWYTGIKM